MKTLSTNSEAETKKIAEDLAKTFFSTKKKYFLNLSGNLGAGKTTFSRHFISMWLKLNQEDVRANAVTSPTFNLVKIYGKKNPIAHMDLYRIHSLDELEQIGFEHYFYDYSVCIVEWLSNIEAPIKPPNSIDLFFEFISENKRKISISNID